MVIRTISNTQIVVLAFDTSLSVHFTKKRYFRHTLQAQKGGLCACVKKMFFFTLPTSFCTTAAFL